MDQQAGTMQLVGIGVRNNRPMDSRIEAEVIGVMTGAPPGEMSAEGPYGEPPGSRPADSRPLG